jgi:multiple sugar transport system substrate-binding protein
MKPLPKLALALLLITSLAACAELPFNLPQPASATPTAVAVVIPTATPVESVEETTNEPKILRVWLPPEFDPNAETEAGQILRERLATFESRRPDLILEVRIKAEEGQSGLLEALFTTQKAAPSILPDLIALPRPALEAAALQGALHPIDGLSELLDDPDWFPYARPLAHIQNSAYGLPFSADIFGLAYRPNTEIENAPELPTLESLLAQETQILFAADQPQAELSFCLYTTYNAPLRNEQGQPTLDADALTNLLTFYQSENIAVKSTEFETDESLWESFLTQPSFAATVWASEYLERLPADAELTPIPAPNGESCALATAWSWALAGSSADLEPAAVELAEYLSDSQFLAAWTSALGSLPPRPTALDETETALHALSLAAQPIPSNDIADFLGEKFRTATMSVLRDQVDPSAAAAEALTGIQ